MYITFIVVSIVYTAQLFTAYHPKLTTWQDVASYDFSLVDQTYEDGTLTNTYGISTPEQLAGVFSIDEYTQQNIDKANAVYADNITSIGSSNDVKQINNEYVLLNDVNMSGRSWTPTANFTGTFNGNYHVIQNLSISSSSYAYLGMVQRLNGTIKNLFLKNINVTNNRKTRGQGGAGSVAGECYGDIENVTVLSGSITGPQYYNNDDRKTGGLTGALTSGGQITNCVNYAFVGRSKFSGGIVGIQYSGTTIQFCYNYGSISNGTNDWPRAGGICGESYGTIKLCVNYGIVTSTTTPEGGGDVRAGGIVGYTTQSIDQCANFGRVRAGSSSTDKTYVGGIAGYNEAQITNCYNMGDITANAKNNSTSSEIDPNIASAYYLWEDDKNKELWTGTEECIEASNTDWDSIVKRQSYDAMSFAISAKKNNHWEHRPDVYFIYRDQKVKKTVYDKKAYAGGIVGYCSSKVTNCYSASQNIQGGCKYGSLSREVKYAGTHYGEGNNLCNNFYNKTKKFVYNYLEDIYYDAIVGKQDCEITNCRVLSNLSLPISIGINSTANDQFSINGKVSTTTFKMYKDPKRNCYYMLPASTWDYLKSYTINDLPGDFPETSQKAIWINSSNTSLNLGLGLKSITYTGWFGIQGTYKYWFYEPYRRMNSSTNEKSELSIENCLGEYQIFDIDYLIGSTEEHITIMKSYNKVYKNSLNGLSSSIWNYSTSINNGYPYLKNLYW